MTGDLNTSENIWLNHHSISGNLYIGSLNLDNLYSFIILLGNINNAISFTLNTTTPKPVVIGTSNGLQIINNNEVFMEMYPSTSLIYMWKNVDHLNNSITNVKDPVNAQDVVNLRYLLGRRVRNNVGYIPTLYQDGMNKQGFSVTTNSEFSVNY